jgi:hypothetical protein
MLHAPCIGGGGWSCLLFIAISTSHLQPRLFALLVQGLKVKGSQHTSLLPCSTWRSCRRNGSIANCGEHCIGRPTQSSTLHAMSYSTGRSRSSSSQSNDFRRLAHLRVSLSSTWARHNSQLEAESRDAMSTAPTWPTSPHWGSIMDLLGPCFVQPWTKDVTRTENPAKRDSSNIGLRSQIAP